MRFDYPAKRGLRHFDFGFAFVRAIWWTSAFQTRQRSLNISKTFPPHDPLFPNFDLSNFRNLKDTPRASKPMQGPIDTPCTELVQLHLVFLGPNKVLLQTMWTSQSSLIFHSPWFLGPRSHNEIKELGQDVTPVYDFEGRWRHSD